MPFQLAAARKDAKQCITLLKKMLPLLEKPWKLSSSPLYHHIEGRESTVIPEQMRERLLEAIRTYEEFEFLRKEPEYEELEKLHESDKKSHRK